MKINRLMITTLLLLSVSNNSYSSNNQTPSLARKPSFDCSIHGNSHLFSEAYKIQWTLDHFKEDYTHWFDSRQVRFSRYANKKELEKFARNNIDDVANARKFKEALAYSNLELPTSALEKINTLIYKDDAQKSKATTLKQIQKNKQAILTFATKINFNSKIAMSGKKRAQIKCYQIKTLRNYIQQALDARNIHNTQYPESEYQINNKPYFASIHDIDAKNLYNILEKLSDTVIAVQKHHENI